MRGLSLHRVGCRRAITPLPPRTCASANIWTWSSERGDKQGGFPAIDAKWQARWRDDEKRQRQLLPVTQGKAYVLPMFPYPSGTLHLGHLRVYTISDVLARFKQMQGYDVIHPIGWDAFGLPAENAALERGIQPETWTLQNIAAMKKQMMAMGGRWDWDRELRTCDPEFYKHTQRLFLELHKHGLAYQAESLVNYDPVDRTVLANEQVDANGRSWRSGAKVEKKMLKQWFLKIKAFQEPLLEDLDDLAENGNWPERVLAMQRNWLGRSEGTTICFNVHSDTNMEINGEREPYDYVKVFTTRADTLFGVQYIAVSLDHPILNEHRERDRELREFLDAARELPPDSKAGYLLPSLKARHKFTELIGIDRDIPVYVAPYVLGDYGSGAVMGVPAHDARDHAFWRANAGNKPIRGAITASPGKEMYLLTPGNGDDGPTVEKGFVASDIPRFGGLPSDQAVESILADWDPHNGEYGRDAGGTAEKTANWRLRDWLISRQRYWGTPIPIIHCPSCGPVRVPVKDLPVKLPQLSDEHFKDKTGNPLADHPEWKTTTCPECNSPAERETDTMDTFMDSSWYFFRFLDPKNSKAPFHPNKANKMMPVDVYVGGVEHAILHLLYARFISKFLATTDMWPEGSKHKGEPFKKLITQGMVHGKTYSDPHTGRFLRPEELDLSNPSNPVIKLTGEAPKVSFEKMSKSKYNGVDPGETIAKYGADVTRAHMLFQAPVPDVLEWDETKITGVERWLTRVVRLSKAPFIPPHILKKFTPPLGVDRPLLDILDDLNYNGTLKVVPRPQGYTSYSEELISALKPSEQILWSKTQETIASVTKAYSETYSLNTIVSDLMTLTNAIWDPPHSSDTMAHLKYYATAHLLRMVAPIAPATAEEGWETLHSTTNTKVRTLHGHPFHANGGPSIFAFGFPTADLDILPELNATTTCVFQVDGKKKFEVEIRKVPVMIQPRQGDPRGSQNYIFDELLKTEVGREWLAMGSGKLWKASGGEEPDEDFKRIPKGWKVVTLRTGRLVNVVSPKKAKGNKRETPPAIAAVLEEKKEAA